MEASLPDIIKQDGTQILIAQQIEKTVKGRLKSKALGQVKKLGDKANAMAKDRVRKYAFFQIESGHIIDNQGVVHTNTDVKMTSQKFITADEGIELRVRKFGAHGVRDGKRFTTKGVDQVGGFMKKSEAHFQRQGMGFKLNFMKTASRLGDLFSLYSAKGFIENQPGEPMGMMPTIGVAIPHAAAIGLVFDLAGMEINRLKQEDEDYFAEELQKELAIAKTKGAKAIERLVDMEPNLELIDITQDTFERLFYEGFTTFEEMLNYTFESSSGNIVGRVVINKSRNQYNKQQFLIEFILLN